MPSAVATHSHRPTTKVQAKGFKSKKATKGALRDQAKGKVPNERSMRKTPHQQVKSKLDRRNQAKQRQLAKFKELKKETSIFTGRDAAPRNVAVIPLCSDSDALSAVKSLNASLDIEAEVSEGSFRVSVDRFKQKLQYVPLKRDLTACLDAARVADFVLFVLSSDVEVDALGELIIRSVEYQGMSTLFTAVQGLDRVEPAKARPDVVKSLASFMTHFHPGQDKIYSLDSRQETSNLMRSLCSTVPKGINWRDQRSWMLVDEVQWPADESQSTVLTGVVRGKGLKADRLVQVGDWGAFQIEKITAAPLTTKKKREEGMAVDDTETETILDTPTEEQEDTNELAPEDANMDDGEDEDMDSAAVPTQKGVLLDDHHYFSDEEREVRQAPKKLPEGTSDYQSKWFLDDVSYSDSEDDDDMEEDSEEVEDEAAPEDGVEGMAAVEPTEAGGTEYAQSEMFIEPEEDDDAQELEAYRAKRRDEAEDDKEFPDEIELPPNVLARERLAKYRGLKSLRTSPWNQEEDRPYRPDEWTRLLQVHNYPASRSQCTRDALVGGVAPGTRVHVHLKGVPASLQSSYSPTKPLTLFSLLRHENKKTALNFDITHKEDFEKSIKGKEELIVQCGPRRFVINPLFSVGGNTENDVHKYCRYLHPGQSAVASFTGPITWGPVPTLFFKRVVPDGQQAAGSDSDSEAESSPLPLQLVATGTARAPSTSRVIAKRVILTGHPYHIHRKVVTIRYMFFNREDVQWFKALPLWTKRGRSGFVKETLGTHGYFKANFDSRINPQDSVGVSLYKRMWPRDARPFAGPLLSEEDVAAAAAAAAGGQEDGDVAMDIQ